MRILLLLLTVTTTIAYSQQRQQFQAIRVEDTPRIDGDLNDMVWSQNAEKVNFPQLSPSNGSPSEFQTSVQIVYTDQAIYVGARLYDQEPQNIQREFGQRDDADRNADWFGIMLDPYNSGINAFTFLVSAAGVQGDYFLTVGDFDENWDAVWRSAIKIDEQGWSIEFAIPYFAIRFPKQEVQTWGVNFYRNVKRKQEESYWNRVDNGVDGIANQLGVLHGLENIEPPLRLSISPYATTIYSHDGYIGKGKLSLAGGADLKYGINESYTLDMSLIPDFSQVQSDNIVYNITPYEVQFNENRQFFTEGTDLYNKSGLFYSRRIGQTFGSADYDPEVDSLISSPTAANLINATKISGRNKKGLGLGLFNAITSETEAVLEDKATGERRSVLVDPLTNFNVLVVDQNLKNNSNINFTNTNVTRASNGRDANVTGLNVTLRDKSNTYQLSAFGALSNVTTEDNSERTTDTGFKYFIDFSKISGKWQFGLTENVESDNYNPRDLGFLRAPNEFSHFAYVRYSILKPLGVINFMNTTIRASHQYLYKPFTYNSFQTSFNNYVQFKNFWGVGAEFEVSPIMAYNYFDTFTEGRYVKQPVSYNYNVFIESDTRKALAGNGYNGRWRRSVWDQSFNWWGFYLRYRVNNKISFNMEVNYEKGDSRGYVIGQPDDLGYVLFGLRDLATTTNIFGFNYTMNTKMGLRLRVRHNWTTVHYRKYFKLANNGYLASTTYSGLDSDDKPLHDENFNALNIDMVFFWQIAPGSFVNIVWKDAIQTFNKNTDLLYFENLENVSRDPQVNSLSVRVTYFLDYLTIRKSLTSN
jgi:Domain of unknown function (DUF5916)/Carbohydrate family 9 binding domain-like